MRDVEYSGLWAISCEVKTLYVCVIPCLQEQSRALSASTPRSPGASRRTPSIQPLGYQLADGPVLLDVGGNPLGLAGSRQVLHSLDWMSLVMENAVVALSNSKSGEWWCKA